MHCGFIFQGFHLFPSLTALQQVALPLVYCGMPARDACKKSEEALEEVNLSNKAHQRPAELSGGEQQRIAVARAIVKKPALLFADEPTSSLDSENGIRVMELLRRAAEKSRALVLCVSHDSRIVPFAKRVVRLSDGRIDLREGLIDEFPSKQANSR
jgi:putative ABC transport system ATP-binding protein